jgi:hypothetical protein
MPKRLKIVRVNDKMQRGYRYVLTAPIGRNFDPEFRPELTPKEMLALGVFCGKYMTDCGKEFPASWFAHARLSPSGRDCSLNYFGVDRQKLNKEPQQNDPWAGDLISKAPLLHLQEHSPANLGASAQAKTFSGRLRLRRPALASPLLTFPDARPCPTIAAAVDRRMSPSRFKSARAPIRLF